SWITATEINNSGFELYRDGILIKFINGNGTTSDEKYYSYTDQNLPNGIYEYELIQIDFDGSRESSAKINVEVDIPLKYELAQNYPNPFNPSTTISFTIPQSDFVTIKIFNSIGEEIETLVNEIMDAGTHRIEFTADRLSNGVYVYTLQTRDHFQSKKMILLK
ncbi:MAG: T9SS type A sorting domain-containing protein, partial [Melioribacteraceae bacterium]|nr:T9SS type A sorting domain-containing protein [Melioribacteraceae bacterium]